MPSQAVSRISRNCYGASIRRNGFTNGIAGFGRGYADRPSQERGKVWYRRPRQYNSLVFQMDRTGHMIHGVVRLIAEIDHQQVVAFQMAIEFIGFDNQGQI